MKKVLTGILVGFAVLFSFASVYAVENEAGNYSVRINGEFIEYPDAQPVLINYNGEKVLYIPMRLTYEALGFQVFWDAESQSATAIGNEMKIRFVNGESGLYVNDVFQTVDRPVRTDNGRTLVSAMALTKSLGYILSWDDISGVLDVISPENFGDDFVYKQSTHLDANTFAKEFKTFAKMTEKAFVIPGLNEYIVPQGISYRSDKDRFYLSGYFKSGALSSVICAVDAKIGKSVGEYVLCEADGTPFYGHVGGIAVTESNLYIAHEKFVYRVSLSTIDSLGRKASLYPEEAIKLSFGDASNSFLDYSGGYLWAGNFYDPSVPESNFEAYPGYTSLIRAYRLDETSPSGFSESKKTTNTDEYDYIPYVIYTHDKLRIQGMATYGNQMYLAASYGKWGEMYVYDIPYSTESETTLVLDGDKHVPVINLTCKKTVKPFPRIEEIVAVNGNIYATFESGAIIYRSRSKNSTTDSVWKLPVMELWD